MRFTYCPDCGSQLEERELGDEGLVPWCTPCGKPLFDVFPVAVIGAVVNEFGEVAVLRQDYLSTTYRTVVSGYIAPGETAEEAMAREIREELGLEAKSMELEGTHWFDKNNMMMIGFLASADKAAFHLSKEVDEAAWLPAGEALELMHPAPAISRLLVEKAMRAREELGPARVQHP